MRTLDAIVEEVTTKYLATLPSNTPVDVIKMELMEKTANEIEIHNSQQLNKALKFPTPRYLLPSQIAAVIRRTRHVIKVDFVGKNAESEYCLLAVYQESGEDEGLYSVSENVIENMIMEFNYDASAKDVAEVIRRLRLTAPTKRRNQNKDLIAVCNGLFDYQAKQLLPFSPDHVFLSKSRVNYVPNPANPIIFNPDDKTYWDVENWMDEVVPDDEVRQLIWEILGAVVRPFVPWNKSAWLFSTSGNSGKGCQRQ